MLDPIDTDKVICDGGAAGRFPGEIHSGVAWWLAACFVVTTQTDRLLVAHDGQVASEEFYDRMCRGATHARHYACRVFACGAAEESELLAKMKAAGGIPGMWVGTTTADRDAFTVAIILYGQDGHPLDDSTGLGVIRRMIAEDKVPIPVNEHSKGSIEPYPGSLEGAG